MTALKNLLLLNYLARDRGHLLDDDRFLAECLVPLAERFRVVSSPESIANIRRDLDVESSVTTPRLPGFATPRMQYVQQVVGLDLDGFDDILIQSPDEISTLVLMRLHPSKRFHLILTYNLTPARFDRHPRLAHAVMRRLLRRAATVFVHCRFEADFIRQHYPEVSDNRVVIKPYHQVAVPRVILDWSQKSRTILFLGPELPYKRIDPVVNMIEHDPCRRYRYVFASMNPADKSRYGSIEGLPNVEFRYGHTPDDEYYRLFSEAAFVVLTHDRSFEGRLSGPFCDAVASGTAVVTRDIAPYSEFISAHGPMGLTLDDDSWRGTIVSDNLSDRYNQWRANMAAFRTTCSMDNIRDVFRNAFATA